MGILNYIVSIESENNTYFISSDKTYVVRFFASIFYVYHIPTGKVFLFESLSWAYKIHPGQTFEFKTLPEFGIFLPSCHNPKIKQMIFEKKFKNGKVSEQVPVSIQFQLHWQGGQEIPPNYKSNYLCFADNLYIDLYL